MRFGYWGESVMRPNERMPRDGEYNPNTGMTWYKGCWRDRHELAEIYRIELESDRLRGMTRGVSVREDEYTERRERERRIVHPQFGIDMAVQDMCLAVDMADSQTQKDYNVLVKEAAEKVIESAVKELTKKEDEEIKSIVAYFYNR